MFINKQQRILIAYFMLVLASAGAAALLLLALPGRVPTLPVLLIVSWVPSIVGVAVTACADGRAGLRQLFGRAVRWRFSWRWYAVATLLPIVAVLLAIGVGMLVGSEAPQFVRDGNVLIPLFVFNVLAGPLGEELGWRGTALPRLLVRWGTLSSSVILGVFWWGFHTPGFWLGLFSPGFTPINSLVGAIALTVLITWLFTKSAGSLIPGSLMHLSVDFVTSATGVANSSVLYGLTVSALTVAALIVVLVPAVPGWRRYSSGVLRQKHEDRRHATVNIMRLIQR